MSKPLCKKCKDRGQVYVHDPSADGHGGLNGGEWVWLLCSWCVNHWRIPGAKGKADYERLPQINR